MTSMLHADGRSHLIPTPIHFRPYRKARIHLANMRRPVRSGEHGPNCIVHFMFDRKVESQMIALVLHCTGFIHPVQDSQYGRPTVPTSLQ